MNFRVDHVAEKVDSPEYSIFSKLNDDGSIRFSRRATVNEEMLWAILKKQEEMQEDIYNLQAHEGMK